jgi:2,4-dienoyl-CoA reductase-like NADH-dependent reductase (Old Yellow Enzyme family)
MARSSLLFSPVTLRGVTLRNRVVVSPMCQYSSIDGFANDWHLVHLGSRAVGGAGAVLTEATAVVPGGRISPDDLGIWKTEQVEMLARIFRFIDLHGAVPGMQLAHAGRKASTKAPFKGSGPLGPESGGWFPVVSASAAPFDDGYQVPVPLDLEGIRGIVAAFAAAAQRLLEAGGRIVEIHAAHGYLLHQFLSPLSNSRTDQYGGSFDNRVRFLCEVVAAVRTVWPERLPLLVRLSASDWTEGGWTVEDSVALSRRLATLGVDAIDCSSGGNLPRAAIPVGPGYQVRFAAQIRHGAGIPTGAVGLITAAEQAEQILRTEQADLIVLARGLLNDPYWPLHAARALGDAPPVPPQYLRAF